MKMKRLCKSAIRKLSKLLPDTSKMTEANARAILEKQSPKPDGVCWKKHELDLKYQLQIIVPAYNAEKYISECIESVLEQDTEYRVLLTVVNDGSTDATQTILNELKDKNKSSIEVELIQQKNQGHSAARNVAMAVLRGEYITFLDADDRLPGGCIEKMLRAAYSDKADILQGSWYTFYGENREEHILSESGVLADNRSTFSGYPWGKLYRNTVLEQFQFPAGFWYEDTPISFILAAMPYRYAAIKDIVYGYRSNPEGITVKSMNDPKSVDTYWITEECLQEFPKFQLKYDQRAYEYVLQQSVMNAWRVSNQSGEVQEAVFVLTTELLIHYFKGFHTEKKNMKELENALQKKKFSSFKMCLHGV